MEEIISEAISELIAPILAKAWPGNNYYNILILVAADIVELLVALAFPEGDELAGKAIAVVRDDEYNANRLENTWGRVHFTGINFWNSKYGSGDELKKRWAYCCLEDLVGFAWHIHETFHKEDVEWLGSLIDAKAITALSGNDSQKRKKCEQKLLNIIKQQFRMCGLKKAYCWNLIEIDY